MWDLPESGISPCVSCIGRWIFYHWATSEARVIFQFSSIQFTSLQLLSHVWLLVIPWAAACQASLSITISWSLLKFMSIESVMLSNHLVLCRPLLLTPSMFPSIRAFSNESVLRIRWPRYWSSINMPLLSRWSSHICAPHKVAHDQVSTSWSKCAVLYVILAVT